MIGGGRRSVSQGKGMGWGFGKKSFDTQYNVPQTVHFDVTRIYTKVTLLDQQVVAVREVNKDHVVLNNDIYREIKLVRQMKHNNVNQLVGACIDPGNVCLVWGYCSKGSLRDVLDNTDIKLDWMFKLSFMTDIARGMNYIHSIPVKVHGRLKSRNVLVDSNWTCKITDLLLPHFCRGATQAGNPKQQFLRMLWVAPELLRQQDLMTTGTQKGDVYSFAIILHEIITRDAPFGIDQSLAEKTVRKLVAANMKPTRPYLPDLPEQGSQEYLPTKFLIYMMLACWDEWPVLRLPFNVILRNLMRIQMAFGTTANLVDQMLIMLQRYTNNLEELVEQRTNQLENEQKKTNELLSSMLPRSVAEELKQGQEVMPESYEMVSLFFSDIKGFADIAQESTPIQVVDLLNDLYTSFDKVIERHDVYKVETIADNYVVSSGLPIRNGLRHVSEVATLALDLLVNALGFKIRHMPGKQLMLRIGIHTGPVVAGVVGKKNPRYCLFGDTVNYTARVQSNGLPLHIHVSPECRDLLVKFGGFYLKERGLVEMKGKGKIHTYFLLGKKGFKSKMPNIPDHIRKQCGIDLGMLPEASFDASSFTNWDMDEESSTYEGKY